MTDAAVRETKEETGIDIEVTGRFRCGGWTGGVTA
nr:NUDIX domain-containing protein [Frankia sp. Cr2]